MKQPFLFIRNFKFFCLLIVFLSILVEPTFSQSIKISRSDTADNYTEPKNIDIKILRLINNYRTGFLDKSLTLTDYSMMPASLIIPVGMFLFGRAFGNTYDENTGFLLGTSELLNYGLTFGLKNMIKRNRPYQTLKGVYYKDVSLADKYSFPSGHASTTFAISTMFALRYPYHPQIYIPLYFWSIIIGYGRVYFGMHYPSDVLGGAALGTLTSAAVYSLRSHILKFKNRLLGEENNPDRNDANVKSMGMIAGVYFIFFTANELLKIKTDRINFEFFPEFNSRVCTWQIVVKLKP